MGYIIDPMWFYWLSVVDHVGTVLVIALVVFLFGTIAAGAGVGCNLEYGPEDSDYRNCMKLLKICFPITVAISLALIFLPSKNTLIEMQVARYATYENAEWTVDTIKSAVDYIVTAISSMK